MAFYKFFNKVTDFANGTENTATTAAFDSDYTDRSVQYGNNVPGVIGWGTALTDIWVHWRHYSTSGFNGNTSTDGEWLRFIDDQGRAIVYFDLLNGTLQVGVSDNGSSFTVSSGVALPANTTQVDIDVHIQINNGGNNTCDVYYDGVLVASGTRAYSSALGIVAMTLTHSDINTTIHYSEGMVADEDTRGLRVAMLEGDGDGGVTDWDGAYTDVAERGDGLVLSTDVVNERQTMTLAAYNGPASPTAVRGVFVQAWAKAGSTGPANMDGVVRISATNYDAGDNKAPVARGPTVWEFANDPSTASAWNTSAFAALEAGVKSIT